MSLSRRDFDAEFCGARPGREPPAGSCGATSTAREIVVNTRRFAKRQRTWFRSLPDAEWLEVAPDGDQDTTPERVQAVWSSAD